ncbi:hypothetical protein ACVWYN_000249 [Pedobacter sp. UYP24]
MSYISPTEAPLRVLFVGEVWEKYKRIVEEVYNELPALDYMNKWSVNFTRQFILSRIKDYWRNA